MFSGLDVSGHIFVALTNDSLAGSNGNLSAKESAPYPAKSYPVTVTAKSLPARAPMAVSPFSWNCNNTR